MRYCLLLFIALQSAALSAQSPSGHDLRYALHRSWAIAPPGSEFEYKIVSYIPELYSLEVLDWNYGLVSGQPYLLVRTQDAVEVLVHRDVVSDRGLEAVLGKHDLIFQAPFELCTDAACSGVQPVARGEAFRAQQLGDQAQLEGWRGGEPFYLYMQGAELSRAVERGLITQAQRPWSPYLVQRKKLPALSTQCSEVRQPAAWPDQVASVLPDDSLMASSIAQGLLDEQIGSGSWGGPDIALHFYLADVQVRQPEADQDGQFVVGMLLEYSCQDGQPHFLESLTYLDSRNQFNARPIRVAIEARLFNSPRNLQPWTGSAYMVSINRPLHFEQAIQIISAKVGDRTLAGYLLTMLNRSCRSSMRGVGESGPCMDYFY